MKSRCSKPEGWDAGDGGDGGDGGEDVSGDVSESGRLSASHLDPRQTKPGRLGGLFLDFDLEVQ